VKEILFVHDQLENPWVRQSCLESAGYRVRAFARGDECLHALGERLPELVLIDVLIEGQNGFELCAAIRANHRAEELPVILCSEVYRDELFQAEARRVGAQRYLLKPCSAEALLTAVASVLPGQGGGLAA
jgi:CheY-like chemotaxis protein